MVKQKRKKKRIRCLDCRKGFARREYLNIHISKTGHEDGIKVTQEELIDIAISKQQSKKGRRHVVLSYITKA